MSRPPAIEEATAADPYDCLPESLKHVYTRHEYAWLSDAAKATLVERETEPETD